MSLTNNKKEMCHVNQQFQLSSAVANAAKAILPNNASRKAIARSRRQGVVSKNLAATIHALAAQRGCFKNCCMQSGKLDGAERHYYVR